MSFNIFLLYLVFGTLVLFLVLCYYSNINYKNKIYEIIIMNSNSESSKLSIDMDQDDEQPEPDPTNYQFYFNKVQIVGKISFKEDHDKLFGNGYSKHNSLQVSPNTKSSSTKVRFIMI